MKKLYFYIPALALLALACNKIEDNPTPIEEEPAPAVQMITETVSGSRGVETKATISNVDATFKWSIGDNVAVHVSRGSSHKYVTTSKGADAAGASAKFEVTYEEGYSRDAFAIYPSYIVDPNAENYGQIYYNIDINLPSSYTLDQVSGETSPCPMLATNTPGNGWEFYQLCSLLRLAVNDIPAAARRLDITVSGGDDRMYGSFKVNKVTSGSINPQTAVLKKITNGGTGGTTITITKDGTDTTLGAENLVINIPLPASTNNYSVIAVKAYDATSGGKVLVSTSLPFSRKVSKTQAFKCTVSFAASTSFRGYEVSAGILKRDGSTSPATYSLTSGQMELVSTDPVTGERTYKLPDGCNPFEPAVYYGNNANKDVYFHKWYTLKDELGADGDNIKADSERLPTGWRFPTGGNDASDWGKILFGAPKTPITVNGTTVATGKAYAMVVVTLESGNSYGVDAGTYYGMLLLRDGTTIPSGYLDIVGEADYTSGSNQLTETEFNYLIQRGCLFISASGLYNGNQSDWRDLSTDWKFGIYWSSTFNANNHFYQLSYFNTTSEPSVSTHSATDHLNYCVAKLVKRL